MNEYECVFVFELEREKDEISGIKVGRENGEKQLFTLEYTRNKNSKLVCSMCFR